MKKSTTVSVSDHIIKILENHGVKYIFGVPGEETEDLLFSIEKSSITFIPTRHEQGAAFMANVWGRMTGKVGVCLSTLGPGATNLLTGLADAYLDKSPVLALTGQAHSNRLHKESHQYIDVVSMFRPITKWNTAILNKDITTEAVTKALKIAEMEKPGVTHIDLPEDVAAMDIIPSFIAHDTVRRASPDYKAVAKAIALMEKAKKPIILAGNGAIRKRASRHLRIISEQFNIPVVHTFMGKGAVSDKSDRSLFSVGMKAKDIGVYALDQADLVIAVGYDIAEYDPEYWNTKKSRPLIHIDFSESETYEQYQPTIEIIADISGTLWELKKDLENKNFTAYSSWYTSFRDALVKDIESYNKINKQKSTVPFVLSQLREVMNDDDIIISDVGAHKIWIGRNFPVYEPGTCIISNGLASMGIALPGGFAAKLACKDQRVVSVMGDGGFLMNSQEIETAKRLSVPYTIVVLNDNNYGLISWKQKNHRGTSVGTMLTNPDFVKYAQSFGITAYHSKGRDDVKKILKKAIESNELCLVVIDIDPGENMKLSEKLKNIKTLL